MDDIELALVEEAHNRDLTGRHQADELRKKIIDTKKKRADRIATLLA